MTNMAHVTDVSPLSAQGISPLGATGMFLRPCLVKGGFQGWLSHEHGMYINLTFDIYTGIKYGLNLGELSKFVSYKKNGCNGRNCHCFLAGSTWGAGTGSLWWCEKSLLVVRCLRMSAKGVLLSCLPRTFCSGNSWLLAWFSQGWFCHF